jgi:uncharacterized protein (DUF488 family)
MELLTVGYQKRTGADLCDIVVAAGVDVLVDVRESAWSYRPDFRRSALAQALSDRGIRYVHARFAGNPRRKLLQDKSHKECLDAYREHLQASPDVLEELSSLLAPMLRSGDTVCFLCYERHPDDCHRSILLEAWSGFTDEAPRILHLEPDGAERFVTG